jgi:hypothetical protein
MNFENPFEEEGNWYRGNLHTHTSFSDGKVTLEEAINFYKKNGYDFLVITDHNKIPEISYNDENFLVIKGIEVSSGKNDIGSSFHLLGIDIEEKVEIGKDISVQEAINLLKEKSSFVIISHPYWSYLNSFDILPLQNFLGIEIFNYGCDLEKGNGLATIHWDELLIRDKKILGFSVDDCHWKIEDAGGGWIMVKSKKLTKESIISAIKKGRFYSSSGPEIFDFRVKDKTAYFSSSSCKIINFVCGISKGKIFRGEKLKEVSFEIKNKEKYLRVECIDEKGRRAWTNPFFF